MLLPPEHRGHEVLFQAVLSVEILRGVLPHQPLQGRRRHSSACLCLRPEAQPTPLRYACGAGRGSAGACVAQGLGEDGEGRRNGPQQRVHAHRRDELEPPTGRRDVAEEAACGKESETSGFGRREQREVSGPKRHALARRSGGKTCRGENGQPFQVFKTPTCSGSFRIRGSLPSPVENFREWSAPAVPKRDPPQRAMPLGPTLVENRSA